jgi:hypothetical protein
MDYEPSDDEDYLAGQEGSVTSCGACNGYGCYRCMEMAPDGDDEE